jgi:hypothetical protein
MAGNIIADENGDVYVEFDYNNIIVVDPNKTIDSEGKIQERLVDPEKLVMYANLEADMLPRTKLAVGGTPNDRIRTISVAKINFLKPTKNSYLSSGYYDQLTGENTTKFKGENQMFSQDNVPKDGSNPYVVDRPADLNNIVDNGLLGITQITIQTNSSFVPTVRIELEDVQGKALFELGNNSPYAAFFNLPYPQFYLTLKGYYGQAVRYQLNLEKFNARFNSFSGNYQVSLEFKGYKFNILNEISMGHLMALPHMYSQIYNVAETPVGPQQSNRTAESQGKTQVGQISNNVSSNEASTVQVTSNKGYQKIIEVYSEYKAKGLISPDFPELTLMQLMNKLQNFEKIIQDSFTKAEVEPLTNIRTYKEYLQEYFNTIRGDSSSWFTKYLNPRPIFLRSKERVYVFNQIDLSEKDAAISALKNDINVYNKYLAGNRTLGSAGVARIPNPIRYETIVYDKITFDQIDWAATAASQIGIPTASETQITEIQDRYRGLTIPVVSRDQQGNLIDERPKFFIFEGPARFDKLIASIDSQATKKLQEYQSKISAELLKKLEDRTKGLGFRPTVRNMMAVILASTEAFIRLMDDVHTNAWSLKDDPVRKSAILNNVSSAPSSETVDQVVTDPFLDSQLNIEQTLDPSKIPVYPWPLFFVETPEDKKGRFQLKYIGDPSVAELTQGFNYDKWPEVQFVEEYLRGITKKFNTPATTDTLENDKYTNILNINAIEFPSFGLAYLSKEELKFFYEIWERQYVTSHYSGLVRANENQINDLITLNTETEVSNIVESINVSAPYLSFKLKNYGLNATNYIQNLENFSNQGTGKSYQDFIRDFFVTPYIKALVENPTSITSIIDLGQIPQTNTTSPALRQLLSVATNDKLVVDTLPFSDPTWCLRNMSEGPTTQNNEVYNTNRTLTVFEPRKIIANFNDVYDFTTNRPVTNFSYLSNKNPTKEAETFVNQQQNLAGFYNTQTTKIYVATEGEKNGLSPTEVLPFQTTTSMLNTPYFVNSIQKAADGLRRSSKYPFISSAYLFLNSLPLASLREKYKTLDGTETNDLDYIASCFNKFGAIHKLPYAWILKMGSVWYRYKLFKEKGEDILTDVWKNFDYKTNYSPILSSETQTYDFTYDGGPKKSVVLQKEDTTTIQINTGFYPKLINDFNLFYNGFELYKDYNSSEIQNSISLGMKVCQFPNSFIEAQQGVKTLNVATWSVLLPDFVNFDVACNPKDNTNGNLYYVVPSFGSQINQTTYECVTNINTDNPTTVVNLTNNSSMYNGSVRTLWSTPNFGYFDNNQIVKPTPEEYINYIDPNTKNQSPFKLLTTNDYSKIEEIFSVFEKSTLDKFELEFLNFCKPITDAEIIQPDAEYNTTTTNIEANFRNFQSLMRSVMVVPKPTATQNNLEYFQDTITTQNGIFQNEIKAFLQYDVIFKNGNPSKFRRRIFDSYLSYLSTPVVTDPIPFLPYVQGSLPTRGGTVLLSQSKLQNPKAWFALETEVGFSTIPNVEYSSTGSYITDFFVDSNIEFTEANVTILAPLIKMYAARKLESPALNAAQFKNQLNEYLQKETNFQNNLLGLVLSGVQNRLPIQQQLPQNAVASAVSGEQSKLEMWEVFKAINDKWISGDDFKTKTLFEDMLFLDRASRNIGDTILIDIFDIQGMIANNSLNEAMSVYGFVASILIKNNFVVMNLPAYVNFYNVQDFDGTTVPQTEGSLDFANSMWGTFLDVDYRKSSPKMVCFYSPRPSNYLDLPKGNFRFRDDSFELRRASENPLIENQQNKTDWNISNKCVGFNVDIGTRNQNIFYSFSVSQDNGVATSESINTLINMSNNATGKNVATQNASLFNIYKQRSYTATVTCLGNAMVQPSMYFNLRHVPMFNGPYMILDVQHQIQPGNFQTSFTGVRQGIYDLPSIDNFLQSINQNLLTNLEEVLKIKKDVPKIEGITNNQKSTQVVQKADNTPDSSNSCVSNVDVVAYPDYVNVPPKPTDTSAAVFAAKLKELLPNKVALQSIIYSISYIRSFVMNSGTKSNGEFKGFNFNFGGISLYNNWAPTTQYFKKEYSCINVKGSGIPNGTSDPLVSFNDLDSYIKFMADRLGNNVPRILQDGLAQYYVCHWPKDSVSVSYFKANQTQFEGVLKSVEDALKSCVDVKIITITTKDELVKSFKEGAKKISEVTINNTPVNTGNEIPQVSQVCPPPTITGFSPLVANTGTILQINGTNLDIVTKIKLIDVELTSDKFTVLNSQTIRLTVPTIGNGVAVKDGKIELFSPDGGFLTKTLFKYDPSVNASTAASPGGYAGNNQSSVVTPAMNDNTNPQNTGPVTLVSKYETQTGGEVTNKLTVSVNQDAGVWNIENNVKMVVSISNTNVSNNTRTQVLNTTVETNITNYVVGNVFTITSDNVKDILFDNPIAPFNNYPIRPNQKVTIQFVLKANAVDKVKYPQPTVQSFNFFYNKATVETPITEPVSITLVYDSNDPALPPQLGGGNAYIIKKNGGGYYGFRFNGNSALVSKNNPELFKLPNLEKQQISISTGPNTKYMNEIIFNGIGEFQLAVGYKLDESAPLQALFPNKTLYVNSPGFTL